VASTLGANAGFGQAAGTGIVLTSTGQVLTNNHVIDGAVKIWATDVGNGKLYAASVVGYDRSADVAVLQLHGASGLETADIGNSSKVTRAEPVVALGNAGGAGGTPAAAPGAVTAVNQSVIASDAATGSRELLSGLIESTVDLQAGDSGGPLVNAGGEVIGMNSAASGNSHLHGKAEHVRGYSIPINRVIRLAEQMQAGLATSTVHIGTGGDLGVVIHTAGGYHGNLLAGVEIEGVPSGSPAVRAGIEAGDIITSIGGSAVGSSSSLRAVLGRYHPGDKVTVYWTDLGGDGHHSVIVLSPGPPA
jgi:S1-C subfamily serine protease